MELQRRDRMGGQLAALAALVVGVPDDAALVEALDQDDRASRAGRRRRRSPASSRSARAAAAAIACSSQRCELLQRIGVRRRFVELGQLVALAQGGDVGHRAEYRNGPSRRGGCLRAAPHVLLLTGKALRRPTTTSIRRGVSHPRTMATTRTVSFWPPAAARGSPPARTSWRQPLRAAAEACSAHDPRPGDRQPPARGRRHHRARSPTWRGSSVAARDVVVLPEVGSDGAVAVGMGHSISRRRRAPARMRPAGSSCRATCRWCSRRRWSRWPACSTHHAVAYAQHRGQRGHPVGFAAELYPELHRARAATKARAASSPAIRPSASSSTIPAS